jgi:hypothetical protein
MIRTTKERIPEILMKPDAAALVRRVRRGLRWARDALAGALTVPAAARAS